MSSADNPHNESATSQPDPDATGYGPEVPVDVEKTRHGEHLQARPVGRLERGWRMCRRNPMVSSLLVLILLLLCLGASAEWLLAAWADGEAREAFRQKGLAEKAQERADAEAKEAFRQKGVAKKAQQRAEKAQKRANKSEATARSEEEKAKFVTYAFRLREAQAELERGKPEQAQAVLRECDPKLRNWEHDYLLRQTLPRLHLQGHTGRVSSVCFSLDGTRIASASRDSVRKSGEVKVWDAQTGQEALTLRGHTGGVSSVCFSPDGTRIASGSVDKTVKLWAAPPSGPVGPRQ